MSGNFVSRLGEAHTDKGTICELNTSGFEPTAILLGGDSAKLCTPVPPSANVAQRKYELTGVCVCYPVKTG